MTRLGILVWIAVALIGGAGSAAAGDMNWRLRSESPYTVQLQFYSQSRNHVWPTPDTVYALDDSDTHEFPLSCRNGEKVCYGAWVKGDTDSYWGSGLDGEQACDDCCHLCDGGTTPTMVLNE